MVVAFHFNKGLAGASPEAIALSRDPATNPQMLSAFALAIVAYTTAPAYPGQPLPASKPAIVRADAVNGAMRALRVAAPNACAYVNECDFFQSNWADASWGAHAPRIESIKHRYDREGPFIVHHGVGSQTWSEDGFERLG